MQEGMLFAGRSGTGWGHMKGGGGGTLMEVRVAPLSRWKRIMYQEERGHVIRRAVGR